MMCFFFPYMLLSKGVSSQNTLRKSTVVLCLSFRTRDISLLGHKPILSLLTQQRTSQLRFPEQHIALLRSHSIRLLDSTPIVVQHTLEMSLSTPLLLLLGSTPLQGFGLILATVSVMEKLGSVNENQIQRKTEQNLFNSNIFWKTANFQHILPGLPLHLCVQCLASAVPWADPLGLFRWQTRADTPCSNKPSSFYLCHPQLTQSSPEI